MNKKNILIATNLNVWSIEKGVGAPSFYKTLELYNNKNCNIYFYTTENDVDISELKNIKTIKMPKLKSINIKYLSTLHRIFNYFLYQIIFIFYFFIKQKEEIDLLYGYEIEFIPSLHFLSKILKKPLVSRYQGSILYPHLHKKFWKLRYFPHYFSIKQNSNLTIMTDDGTKGETVINEIRNKSNNILFLKNGIDFLKITNSDISKQAQNISTSMKEYEFNFISVSRLQEWKRVDRSIEVFENFHSIHKSSRYIIVGEGNTKKGLENYVKNKKLQKNIIFTGGINAFDVNFLMSKSDVFLSHYQLSNLGNPLWEAMNNNCLITTVNNGDTGKIIKDGTNGIISNENEYLNNSSKLIETMKDINKVSMIIKNSKKTLTQNVKSWEQRLQIEYKEVYEYLKIE
jgi:L-malate glycosyltransferase